MKKWLLIAPLLLLLPLAVFAQSPQTRRTYCEVVERPGCAQIVPNEDYLTADYWNFILKEDGKTLTFKNSNEAVDRLVLFGWDVVEAWYDSDKNETHTLMGKTLGNSLELRSSREQNLKWIREAEKKYGAPDKN